MHAWEAVDRVTVIYRENIFVVRYIYIEVLLVKFLHCTFNMCERNKAIEN